MRLPSPPTGKPQDARWRRGVVPSAGASLARPLEILLVNTQDQGGGAAASSRRLRAGYAARGHHATLVVGRKSGTDPAVVELPNHACKPFPTRLLLTAASRLERSHTRIRGAWRSSVLLRCLAEPRRRLGVRLGHEDFACPGTARLLDLSGAPADVLHLQNLHESYFDLRRLPQLCAAVPTFLTVRDAWTTTGHCGYTLDCERWRRGCGACPYLHTDPPLARDASAYNWARKRDIFARCRLRLASPSRWLLERVLQSMVAPAVIEARVIPNGVDGEVFHCGDRGAARAALGLPPDTTVLLAAAHGIRHSPWKGYPALREAVARVAQADPDRPLLLLAMGEQSAPEQIGQARIQFMPYEHQQQRMALYYQAADIFVHSAKAESFGNVVLEARACGLAVVAAAVGGIPEQIEDGRDGLLTAPDDSAAMARAILGLLRDPARRRGLGQAAAASAADRFTVRREIDAYLDWFAQVLDDRQPLRRAA
jgi:glycosyltransferase involved in cell wall biosynthesis